MENRSKPEPFVVQGNALHLPFKSKSVHCCVTSPPYFNLREYAGEQKTSWPAGEYPTLGGTIKIEAMDCPLGLEPTPDAYVWHMILICREVRRVLRDEGTFWLNVGDSYSGAGYSNNDINGADWKKRMNGDKRSSRQQTLKKLNPQVKPKDMMLVPHALAFALRADGWYLRQTIIWSKASPMPGAMTDRCTSSHEPVFLLAKQSKYFFDNVAIAEPVKHGTQERYAAGFNSGKHKQIRASHVLGVESRMPMVGDRAVPELANKRDVWRLANEPCKHAHFATMPTALASPCILAGTSAKGCCAGCGAPIQRVVKRERVRTRPGKATKITGIVMNDGNRDDGRHVSVITGEEWVRTCDCKTRRILPCRVLDPFTGQWHNGDYFDEARATVRRHGTVGRVPADYRPPDRLGKRPSG